MHRSLARYSAPVSFVQAPSWADFITTMVGFKVFGTHRCADCRSPAPIWAAVANMLLMSPRIEEGLLSLRGRCEMLPQPLRALYSDRVLLSRRLAGGLH